MSELQTGPVDVEGDESEVAIVDSVRAELELACPSGYGGGRRELLVEGCLTTEQPSVRWLGLGCNRLEVRNGDVNGEAKSDVEAAFLSS